MKKIITLGLIAVVAAAQAQTLNSEYKFNNSLATTTNANGHAGPAKYNVSGAAATATYGSTTIQGATKSYLNVAVNGTIQDAHGFTANGGGSYVNQFTFIELVKPTAAFTIYDSTDSAKGNGPEAWLDSTGHIHTGTDGTTNGSPSSATVSANAWHWFAVSVDTTTTTIKVYVDGSLYLTNTTQGVDGKESLYTYANGGYTDFFTNTKLTGVGSAEIADLQNWSGVLTQQQILKAESVPEPISMTLLGLGALALILRRK